MYTSEGKTKTNKKNATFSLCSIVSRSTNRQHNTVITPLQCPHSLLVGEVIKGYPVNSNDNVTGLQQSLFPSHTVRRYRPHTDGEVPFGTTLSPNYAEAQPTRSSL